MNVGIYMRNAEPEPQRGGQMDYYKREAEAEPQRGGQMDYYKE